MLNGNSNNMHVWRKLVYCLYLSVTLTLYFAIAVALTLAVLSLDANFPLQSIIDNYQYILSALGIMLCWLLLLTFYGWVRPLSRFFLDMQKVHYNQGKNKKITIEEAVGNFVTAYARLMRKLHIRENTTLLLYENALLLSSKIGVRELVANFLANICNYDKRWVVGNLYCFDQQEQEYRQEATYSNAKFRNTAPVIHATFANIFSSNLEHITQTLMALPPDQQFMVSNNIAHSLNQYYGNKVKELKIDSILRFPILLEGKIYAIVELLAKRPIKLQPAYLQTLNILSRQLAFALSESDDIHFTKQFRIM